MNGLEIIARILHTDEDDLRTLDERLSVVSGKRGVLDALATENETRLEAALRTFGLTRTALAGDVYRALLSKVNADDRHLATLWGNPNVSRREDAERVVLDIRKRVDMPRGFFLKPERAADLLRKAPPERVMAYAKASSVDELLKQEDLFELYCTLRFIESREWMNTKFLPLYQELTPDDFEERDVSVRVLDTKWNEESRRFVQAKWHNISHLKELGVIFVIPIMLGISGELLRMVALTLHYLNEIPFYASLFKARASASERFSQDLISLLRGDVPDKQFELGEQSLWLVVQRYLAKDDPYDWRLFVPRVNPEAYHWLRAEKLLASFDSTDIAFWQNLGWVGNYFKDETGSELLVSFDLVDAVMSLVMEKQLVKYLYHQQEALWNQMFISYFGIEELERRMKEHLLRGYFEI